MRKLQRALDAIAELWGVDEHLRSCLKLRVSWRVQPSRDDVASVVAHHEDARVDVRRVVLVALGNAGPHGDVACPAIARGLADDDRRMRIVAARAAASLGLGEALVHVLAKHLADPIWTVRWYAAAALASTAVRSDALGVLLRSEPRASEWGLHQWTGCARAFRDEPLVAQRLAARPR